MCLPVTRNLISIKTGISSNFLIILFLDLILKYYKILFYSSTFFQNTANQRPPATFRADHNKSADRPPVRREMRTRLSDPSPCQHRHLLTNNLSGIVIDYCSACRRGMLLSAMVCPLRGQSSIWQERQRHTF